MASYIIAGKADDPSFARAEYAAKQVETACPSVFFHYEMKHPDDWKAFITSVARKYDFAELPNDFPGPLVWTHEGTLIGNSTDFVQNICIDKFGVTQIPSLADPVFKHIAADNLRQVKIKQHREAHGPPFVEKCGFFHERAIQEGLITFRRFTERRKKVVGGAYMEVWIAADLDLERARLQELSGQPARVDASLQVGLVGADDTHAVFLHPRPLASKHLILVPQRHVRDVPNEQGDNSGRAYQEVPPHSFRNDLDEDLSGADFSAAIEVSVSVGGVATWMGLRRGEEYRDPLDTHLQVLPYPLHTAGEDCPLRYPLELLIDRAVKTGESRLGIFPFEHALVSLRGADDELRSAADAAKAVYEAYTTTRERRGSCECFMLAFTTSWFLFVQISPPEPGTARHEAWSHLPPPAPCALCGVVLAPPLQQIFPETTGTQWQDGAPLVSDRAEQEGIPKDSHEFEAASREVRICTRILDAPVDIIGVWVP